jgi:hypothetical protein
LPSLPGQLEQLLAVKNHLFNVTAKEAEIRLRCDTVQGILDVLRTPGVEAPGAGGARHREKELGTAQSRLDKAVSTWEEAKKHAPVCKASIAPHVKTQSVTVSCEIIT